MIFKKYEGKRCWRLALFKIKKGVKANLPTSYVEGYCYFTTDDGKFYIDTTNAASGRICLNAY